METEVILMQDVEGLGKQGDKLKVSPGHARNYLFPRKLAAPATQKYVKLLEMDKLRKEAEARRAIEALREQAANMSRTSCTISVRAGEDGKLFGSVTAQDIAEHLAQAGITVDRKQIELAEPIKELGVFTVEIRLHPDVVAPVKVWVVEK